MNEHEVEFMAKVYLLIQQIEALTREYGFEDRVMSAMVFGLIEAEMQDAIEEGRMVVDNRVLTGVVVAGH